MSRDVDRETDESPKVELRNSGCTSKLARFLEGTCVHVNICADPGDFYLFGGSGCISPTSYGGLFLSAIILAILASLALIVSASDDIGCSHDELSFVV